MELPNHLQLAQGDARSIGTLESINALGAGELSHLAHLRPKAVREFARAMRQFAVARRWNSPLPRSQTQTSNKALAQMHPQALRRALAQAYTSTFTSRRAAGPLPAVAGAARLRRPTTGSAAPSWQNPCSPKLAQRFAATSSPPPLPSASPPAHPASHRMIAARRLHTILPSSAMASAYSAYHGAANGSQFTVTALGRWSILNTPLPGGHRPRRASAILC